MRRTAVAALIACLAAEALSAESAPGATPSEPDVVYDCETPAGRFTVATAAGACRVDRFDGLLSRRDGGLECRISNPQLRIVTVAADLGFVYEDTDSDRTLYGRCRRR